MKSRCGKGVKIGVPVILVLCLIFVINPVIRYRNHQLKAVIQSVSANEKTTLEELIPFEWDYAYCFTPYTSKKDMTEKMGFESRYVSEAEYDDMVSLYIVKDNRVVAYLRESMDGNITSQCPEVVKYGSRVSLQKA